jgi:hypothetical protein
VPIDRADGFARTLRALLPTIDLTPCDSPTLAPLTAFKIQISSHRRPLRIDAPETVARALIAALGSTRRDEVLLVQWVHGHRLRAIAFPNRFEDYTHESWWQRLAAAPLRAPGPVDVEFRNALRTKQSVASWRIVGRIGLRAPDNRRERQLLARVLGGLRVAEGPSVKLGATRTRAAALERAARPWRWPSVLNAQELLGLLAWPIGDHDYPSVNRQLTRQLPALARIPSRGRVIAESTFPGQQRRLALNPEDASRHLLAVGPTGTGKSTLLLGLITQDMVAGRAVVVVEPKGDLIEDVLARVPEHRRRDVVVLDPSDEARPVGFNPLARRGSSPNLAVEEILSVFRGLYGNELGPRSGDILHAGLLTLTRQPGASLPLLPLLFSNEVFRRRLTTGLDDPLGIGGFWAWWEGISVGERHAATAPLMNKLRPFLLRPAMVGVIGQAEPRFDLHQVLDRKQILLVNLAQGRLGAGPAQLFGSLVITGLWQAIRARGNVAPNRRHPSFIYVDEAPQYLHLPVDLADMLVQSRSYGVGVNLAAQHLTQFPADLRAAVLSNARSQDAFQLSGDDARTLAKDSRLIRPEDFMNLGRYEVYLRLVADGETTPWASGRTLPPPETTSEPADIRRLSRQQWGVDRADIERQLRRHLVQPEPAQTAIGRRPRPGSEGSS